MFNQTSKRFHNHLSTVASLGRVTPGAATEGVTPLFFPRQFCGVIPVFFSSSQNLATFFLLIAVTIINYHYRFLLLLLGCHPPGCHPTPFVRPRFSTILCKFAHRNFGCHPPAGCHPGRSPLVTPLFVTLMSGLT